MRPRAVLTDQSDVAGAIIRWRIYRSQVVRDNFSGPFLCVRGLPGYLRFPIGVVAFIETTKPGYHRHIAGHVFIDYAISNTAKRTPTASFIL